MILKHRVKDKGDWQALCINLEFTENYANRTGFSNHKRIAEFVPEYYPFVAVVEDRMVRVKGASEVEVISFIAVYLNDFVNNG